MTWRKLFQEVDRYMGVAVKWVGYIAAAAVVLTYISKFFAWGNSGPFVYLRGHIQVLWLLALTAAVVVLWIRSRRLHQQFVSGFSDNFRGNLESNWDFRGLWRIPEKDTLLVTGSDEGGITKTGIHWENYTLTFKARIINKCLGVVVRAQDLNNYYMFQIRPDKIRPHRRTTVPVLVDRDDKSEDGDGGQGIRAVQYLVGWQTEHNNPEFQSVPISPKLEDWFDVKVVVKGQSVEIHINNRLIYQRPSFLQIPTGKVGFRNAFSEEAHVQEVRVTLQS